MKFIDRATEDVIAKARALEAHHGGLLTEGFVAEFLEHTLNSAAAGL